MDMTPLFHLATAVSRKTRLKCLAWFVGIILVCALVAFTIMFSRDSFSSQDGSTAAMIVNVLLNITIYGIFTIPFLLLLLIPRHNRSFYKNFSDIDRAIYMAKKQYEQKAKDTKSSSHEDSE